MSRLAAWSSPVRLGSGLVLLAYLTTHFANHALGLVSVDALEAGRRWFTAAWRSPPGTVALYGALTVHLALALSSLYRRRTLKMPRWEAVQLGLGLAIPPLLASHIIGTRLAYEWFGSIDSYTRVVLTLWVLRPEAGARQTAVLIVAWLHGCVGLHFWLRLKPWYPRVAPVAFAAALLVPVLALLGFAAAGRELAERGRVPGFVQRTLRAARAPDPAQVERLHRVELGVVGGYATAVAMVLGARAIRRSSNRRRGAIRITYPNGREVVMPIGSSVLEASRSGGIPHASVCGGRGRCSTCRVRVLGAPDTLPPPLPEELRVLKRVGAPPNVRLACQLRPTQDLTVVPLLPATAGPADSAAGSTELAGQEREIAVLFADLRGFTRISEQKLPYDVVFILNRFFDTVGRAVMQAGGIVNQFTGDGVMALFGVDTDPEDGCRRALAGAVALVHSIDQLSRALAAELPGALKIGIGIHTGPTVVGRMGYGEATYLTAVGDTVHVAARLEELTKTYDCQLVISAQVATRARIDASPFPRHELTLRNRREPLWISVIADVASVASSLASPRPVDTAVTHI